MGMAIVTHEGLLSDLSLYLNKAGITNVGQSISTHCQYLTHEIITLTVFLGKIRKPDE